MMQPVAITIEDIAIHIGRKAGIKESCMSSFEYQIQVEGGLTFSQGKQRPSDMHGS